MKLPLVHLPLDFEQRAEVRTLARIFRQHPERFTDPAAAAAICVLRLWMDWGRVGRDWRPLQHGRVDRDWLKENLAHLIAECCQWTGDPGDLMAFLLEAGVLVLTECGDLDGLILTGFSDSNPHLLPGYESLHSKGARIMHEKRRAEEVAALALQQSSVLQQAGFELFPAEAMVTPEEQQKCIALVMGFDGVCARTLRTSAEYVADAALMRDALRVLRGHTWEDIILVQRYIRGQRANPVVVKDTAAILRGFDAHLGKAKQ